MLNYQRVHDVYILGTKNLHFKRNYLCSPRLGVYSGGDVKKNAGYQQQI